MNVQIGYRCYRVESTTESKHRAAGIKRISPLNLILNSFSVIMCCISSSQGSWRWAEAARMDQESLLQSCTMQHIAAVMDMSAKYDRLE